MDEIKFQLWTYLNKNHEEIKSSINYIKNVTLDTSILNLIFQFAKSRVFDINFVNEHAQFPILIASYYNRAEILKLLLQIENVNVNLQNGIEKDCALAEAVAQEHIEIIKILLTKSEIDLHIDTGHGWTPMRSANPGNKRFRKEEIATLLENFEEEQKNNRKRKRTN